LKPLKIYHLTSELYPYVQSSALSEFSKSISIFLNDQDNYDMRTIHPKYGFISERKYILREVIRLKDMEVNFANKTKLTNIKSAFIPNTRSQIYFLEFNDYYKDLPDLLYKSRNGRIYKDNEEKFSFFVESSLETLKKLFWVPDVIIFNDWQTSILPLLLKKRIENDSWFKNIKTVFFLHSNSPSFNFPNTFFEKLDIKYNKRKASQNLMELAINNADFTFVFDDFKDKKIKSLLDSNKHKIIGPTNNLNSSERLDVFNSISKELSSLI
jgi:starch synthase